MVKNLRLKIISQENYDKFVINTSSSCQGSTLFQPLISQIGDSQVCK